VVSLSSYGLAEKTIQAVKRVFSKYENIEEAVLYGSRAKGNYSPGSDIDITLKGREINLHQLNKINIELDDLLLPYTFDISIFDHISNPDLIEHIGRVGMTFYQQNMSSDCFAEILRKVFIKYEQIAFAYLFGSVALGEQTVLSDLDIAVYLKKDAQFTFDDTLHFQGDCCRVLKRNDIDVLVLNKTRNLLLLEDIVRNGKIIYNTDHTLFDEFELGILHVAYDFKLQRLRELGA